MTSEITFVLMLPFALMWRAWRRGRRAGELGALPWEELLAEPLAEVRRIAGIDAPELAHPDGVRVDPDAAR